MDRILSTVGVRNLLSLINSTAAAATDLIADRVLFLIIIRIMNPVVEVPLEVLLYNVNNVAQMFSSAHFNLYAYGGAGSSGSAGGGSSSVNAAAHPLAIFISSSFHFFFLIRRSYPSSFTDAA
jgi:hypothetical protein